MKFDDFIDRVKEWGENTSSIDSIVLVGSYARGTNKPTSDIDLCILTTEKDELISDTDVFSEFGEVQRKTEEYYGAVTSIRIWYKDGFEVEYGIAEPSWIDQPLDAGTHQVLIDGYKVLIDKYGKFENIEL